MEAQRPHERLPRALRDPELPGSTRLAAAVARYGKAIEYDLAALNLDLAALWRTRRWRKLLSILDQLPRNSRYVEAQLDDEDLAEYLATEPAGQPIRRISEWTAEVETLSVVADRLVDVVNVLLQVNGGNATDFRPQPRPSTALDRVRVRQRELKHQALVARVLAPPA